MPSPEVSLSPPGCWRWLFSVVAVFSTKSREIRYAGKEQVIKIAPKRGDVSGLLTFKGMRRSLWRYLES